MFSLQKYVAWCFQKVMQLQSIIFQCESLIWWVDFLCQQKQMNIDVLANIIIQFNYF